MDWLSKVAEHHDTYLRYVHAMGAGSLKEDIVQDMYIRLARYSCERKVINSRGNVDKTYVWRVLRNMFLSYIDKAGRMEIVSLEKVKDLASEEIDFFKEEAFQRLDQKIDSSLNELDVEGYPYNKELFLLYSQSGMSMRKINALTNISVTSIYNTINNCRAIISNDIGEDYEDYKNKEYERV